MKMTKRIAAMVACAVMAATSMVGIGASAADEQIKPYEEVIAEEFDVVSANDTTIKLLPVPFCPQETYYYCAPATFQQVYAYYKGIENAVSQRSIALMWGMKDGDDSGLDDFNKITDWLNKFFYQQLNYEWKFKNGAYTSSATMRSFITSSINSDVPVIIHISKPSSTDWKYSVSDGHYLNATGYTTDYIQLTDPYLEGHGISSGKYLVTPSLLYKYCDRMAVNTK
ncbi:MAG: C39 family peptidase [Ruminococcus flavefaciens]|nr:C39 family peptidase [Ruminococcus flavefaciens]MCM1059276.1 C39 family peptidase [Eubacterium sp.]